MEYSGAFSGMAHFAPKPGGCPEDQATTKRFATDSGTGKTGESTENEGCVEARQSHEGLVFGLPRTFGASSGPP